MRPFVFARFVAVALVGATAIGCGRSVEDYVRSGDEYLLNKQYRDAIVQYRNALKEDSRRGDVRYNLAKAYAGADDAARARKEFVRAADLLPNDAAVQLDAARALVLDGQFEDARTRVNRVVERDPKNADAHLVRAYALTGLRDFDGAIAAIERTLELQPTRSDALVSLASIHARQGRREPAEAAFKRAVEANPRSVDAHLAFASYYIGHGELGDAERLINQALAIDPDGVAANRALAAVYAASGRTAEAEAPLKRLAEKINSAEAGLELADYYIAQGRAADARAVLTRLASRQEAFAAAMSRLAGIEYQEGRRDRAHAMLDEVLAKQAHNAQVLVVKGTWLLGEGKIDEAFTRAQAAVRASPGSANAHFLLGSVHAARNESDPALKAYGEALQLDPRHAAARTELTRVNLALGRKETATQLAIEGVQQNPGNAAARLMLAKAYLASDRTDSASAELQPLLAAAPNSSEVQAVLGQLLHRRGDRAKARLAYERALALDPMSVDALTGLVTLDVGDKQIQRAKNRVDAHLAKVPANGPFLLLAARTYATAGDLDAAEATLKRAIQVDPSLFPAYNVLGQLYVKRSKLDEALREYEALASKRPDDVAAHTMAAMILQVQNRQEEARKRYERILQIDSASVVAANNLAYMHAESGSNLDIALDLAQTAKRGLPDDPDVNDTLGWVYYKRDMAELAVEPLQRSVERDPTNPLYRYHLGLTYLKLGNKTGARDALQRAVQMGAFDEAEEARKILASIQG